MSEWIPPGYVSVVVLVRDHGVEQVRSDLFSGRLEAFEWEEGFGDLRPLEPKVWCTNGAEEFLRTGTTTSGWPHYNSPAPSSPGIVLVRLGEQPKPRPAADGVYLSSFMQLMLEAVQHFEISEERWPKKEELEQYFTAQKLPDGTPVSAAQASYLATFCRPLAALRGGNKAAG
jgi:hypothetical protein